MIVPSRESNPFATCWTNPGVQGYVVESSCDPAALVAKLAALGGWGEIVGPHGVGKSTLLAALVPLIRASGRKWQRVDFHIHQVWRGIGQLRAIRLDDDSLLVIDGFEQLIWPLQQWVRWRCWRARAGLLVTSHKSVGLPKLVCLAPSLYVAEELFHRLVEDRPSPVTTSDVHQAFKACKGNLRNLLLDLYDLHEQRTRCVALPNPNGKIAVLMPKKHVAEQLVD